MHAETPALFSVSQISLRKCPSKSVAIIARIQFDLNRFRSSAMAPAGASSAPAYHSLKSPLCSCVSIMLPVSSQEALERSEPLRRCLDPARLPDAEIQAQGRGNRPSERNSDPERGS